MENHEKCSVSRCNLDGSSRRSGTLYCEPHYQQAYRGNDPEAFIARPGGYQSDRACLVDGCTKRAREKLLCRPHYEAVSLGKMEAPDGVAVKLRPMCVFSGCDNRAISHRPDSLCRGHAQQRRNGAELRSLREWGEYVNGKIACSIRDCNQPARTRDLCTQHYSKAIHYKVAAAELQELLDKPQCQNLGCGATTNLVIDHDHSTGKVRDVLCSTCNTALGLLGESQRRAAGLIAYMRAHADAA